MILKRKIYDKLLAWKKECNGSKVLLIEGARRIGKSTVCEEFAKNEYQTYIIIDFAKKDATVEKYFTEHLNDLDTFFMLLSTYYKKELVKRNSIIIFDEVQQPAKLSVGELQFGVVGGTAHREDTEESPGGDAERDKIVFEFAEVGIVLRVDAGDDVPQDILLAGEQPDSLAGMGERLRVTAYPVVLLLLAVETDGDAVHAVGQQALQPLLVEQVSVGHHPPGILPAVQLQSHLLQVVAQQCLAAGEDDEDLVGVDMRRDGVDHLQEIFGGHILHVGQHLTVAPTVTAAHIAPQRTLPEERLERMQLLVGLTQ